MRVCVYIYIYIYIYTCVLCIVVGARIEQDCRAGIVGDRSMDCWESEGSCFDARHLQASRKDFDKPSLSEITDGIGAPDPNPRDLVNWCF